MTSISDPSHTGATPPAERELQAQRLVMEHAQKLAHIGHWEFQTDGTIVHASSQVLEIFGFPQGTTPSQDEFRALVPPSELDQVQAAINAIRGGHLSTPVRHRVMRPDGAVRWVDHSFDFRPGEPGDTPVLMGVMKDVTAEVASVDAMRQSAEAIRLSGEAIHESDDRQREALRIARASIWTWDRGTRAVWQSPDLFWMLGYEGRPKAYADRVALWHPNDRERLIRMTEDAIRRREPYTLRDRHARAGGGWAWIETRGVPVFDAAGELTGYRGTSQDVDEQVSREEALRESDDRQREALRIAHASIWTWDRATRTIWNSPALFEMLGHESSGDASKPTKSLRHPDDLERATLIAEEAIRRREPYTFRSRLAHADGRWLWTEERGSPLFDASGELVTYRGTTQDVDEQFRREEALRESDDRQREALRIARASLWVWDRMTRTLSESDDLYQMFGYEIVPRTFDDRVALRHPDDRESSRQLAEDAVRRREPYTIHYRISLPAGG